MNIKHFAVAVLVALASLLPSSAFAAGRQGWVDGTLRFYNNQGNFCPTSRSCSGAQYLQSEFNSILPIRNVKVRLKWGTLVVGQGVTDQLGVFNFQYTIPSDSTHTLVLETFLEEANGRFQVYDGDETTRRLYSNISYSALDSGGSLGTFTWGSSSSPNPHANIYDSAWRTWYKAFSYSGLMNSYFTGVKIFAFNATACPTSCASGDDKEVIIDSVWSAYAPMGRTMHELGHIASDLASPGQSFKAVANYCYPNTSPPPGGNCGWSETSSEWGSDQFEEGLATFLGMVAIYWGWNPEPHHCLLSGAACANNSFDIEDSSGCTSADKREPLQVVRYLWDLYDTSVEGTWDTTNEGYGWFFSAVNDFKGGSSDQYGNRGKNEPYNSSGSVDDYDGRSAYDFYFIWEDLHSNNAYSVRSNNCLPGIGD